MAISVTRESIEDPCQRLKRFYIVVNSFQIIFTTTLYPGQPFSDFVQVVSIEIMGPEWGKIAMLYNS